MSPWSLVPPLPSGTFSEPLGPLDPVPPSTPFCSLTDLSALSLSLPTRPRKQRSSWRPLTSCI